MILKKPYAFLIKYFKIIHFALVILLGFTTYKLYAVIGFFNTYIKNGYTTNIVYDLDKTYLPLIIYVSVLAIIIFLSAILILLRHKQKPYKMYLIIILYYIGVFIGIMYIANVLRSFSNDLLAATTARNIYDIMVILSSPQYLFCLLLLMRGVGFDVKKFDFVNNSSDMNEYGDNDEFEFNVNLQGYKIKRETKRIKREFKYYFIENKLIFIVAAFILIVIIGVSFIKKKAIVYDKTYDHGTQFFYNNFELSFNDSVITNLDYAGDIIDGNYYYVVLLNIKNTSNKTLKIDYNNFKLKINKKLINPSITSAKNFIDISPETIVNELVSGKSKTVPLAYKIEEKDIEKDASIQLYNGSVYKDNEYIDKHIFVTLNPNKIDEVQISNYNINEKIDLSDTIFGNSDITITDYEIDDRYIYKYDVCKKEKCTTYNDMLVKNVKNNANNKIVILNVEKNFDKENTFIKSKKSLKEISNKFIKIQYKIEDKVISDSAVDITPDKAQNFVAFEVPSEISDASIIQALFTIRNKRYIINLRAET